MLSGKHYIQWLKNLWFVNFLCNWNDIFSFVLSMLNKVLFSLYFFVCSEEQTSYNTENRSIIPWLYETDFEKMFVVYVNTDSKNLFSHTYFPLFCMFNNAVLSVDEFMRKYLCRFLKVCASNWNCVCFIVNSQ